MPDYLFVDGPLAGQSIGLPQGHDYPVGSALLIEVVDVDQPPETAPGFTYLLHSEPHGGEPGHLRHAP